jgi:hypothetical protein
MWKKNGRGRCVGSELLNDVVSTDKDFNKAKFKITQFPVTESFLKKER